MNNPLADTYGDYTAQLIKDDSELAIRFEYDPSNAFVLMMGVE